MIELASSRGLQLLTGYVAFLSTGECRLLDDPISNLEIENMPYYAATAFRLDVSDEELSILAEMQDYHEDCDIDEVDPSDRFLAAFPPNPDDHLLSGYHEFLDCYDVPHGGEIADCISDSSFGRIFASDEIDLDQMSEVLFRVCKSAFPIRFTWATAAPSLDPDECGGGFTCIDHNGISGRSSFELLEEARAVAQTREGSADLS